jgi:hypothetical protein
MRGILVRQSESALRDIMGEPFDENNPWHVQADFVLMFYCETKSCHALVDVGDLSEEQNSLDWPRFIVPSQPL